MKRNSIKISIRSILDLIVFGDKININNDRFYEKLANLLQNSLSDQEINEYASFYLSKEAELKGYTKEDYEICVDILEEFKKDFIDGR